MFSVNSEIIRIITTAFNLIESEEDNFILNA